MGRRRRPDRGGPRPAAGGPAHAHAEAAGVGGAAPGRADVLKRTDRDLYVTDRSRRPLTPDLVRQGNASGPRLDHVRFGADRIAQRKAVDVRPYAVDGELWVPGQAGGVSTFDRPTEGEPHWWCIPAGTELPPELVARRDHTLRDGRTHYSLTPAYDVPLSTYRAALAALDDRCRRIS